MRYSDTLKKSTKKFLRDKISKRLLQFKENHSIKSKYLKFIVKKKIAMNIKHANLMFNL